MLFEQRALFSSDFLAEDVFQRRSFAHFPWLFTSFFAGMTITTDQVRLYPTQVHALLHKEHEFLRQDDLVMAWLLLLIKGGIHVPQFADPLHKD